MHMYHEVSIRMASGKTKWPHHMFVKWDSGGVAVSNGGQLFKG